MTKSQIWALLSPSSAMTMAAIQLVSGMTEAELLPILAEVALDNGSGGYMQNTEYDPDAAVLQALRGIVCDPPQNTACQNDVVVVLTTTGKSVAQWSAGVSRTAALVSVLQCQGLRTKLASGGVDLADFDALLASISESLEIQSAMISHAANPAL